MAGGVMEVDYANQATTQGAEDWNLETVRIYVDSPAGRIGAMELKPQATSPSEHKYEAYLLDHLGSIQVVMDLTADPTALPNGKRDLYAASTRYQRYSYDPWGERRDAGDWLGNIRSQTAFTWSGADDRMSRGFTGHEMLDHLGGLVHMNGRIYDPVLGRFLSADLIIQSPYDLQSYNRYSYVMNNPLRYVDPTGYETIEDYQRRIDELQAQIKQAADAAKGNLLKAFALIFTQWGRASDIHDAKDAIAKIEDTAVQLSDLIGGEVDPMSLDDDDARYQNIRNTLDVLAWIPGSATAREVVKGDYQAAAKAFGTEVAVTLAMGRFVKWVSSTPNPTGAAYLQASQGLDDAARFGLHRADDVAGSEFLNDALRMGEQAAPQPWKYGAHKSLQKIQNQMAQRGWNEKQIQEALQCGEMFPAVNNINPANSATRFVHPATGRSIVIDDLTREVLHVGGNGFLY